MRGTWRALLGIAFAVVACNDIVGFGDFQRGGEARATSPRPDDDDDELDTEPDTGAPKPAVDAGPRCDLSKPFGSPAIDPSLDGTSETKSALMTPDELEIFYLRGERAPFELRHAVRSSREAPWEEPVTETLSPDSIRLGSIGVGGKKLYYYRVDFTLPTAPSNVFMARRPGARTPFGGGEIVTGPNRAHTVFTANDDGAFWSEYFVDGGVTEQIIFRGSVASASVVSRTIVANIHQAGALDDSPVLDPSETLLYFASTRPGGFGSSDIWTATRASKTADFGAPVHVPELSSPGLETPSWVSPDGCVILIDRASHVNFARRPN